METNQQKHFKARDLMREGFGDIFKAAADKDVDAFITISGTGYAASKYPQYAGKKFRLTLVESE